MKFVNLGSVAEVIAGQSPRGVFYNSIGLGMPFYQGKKEFGDRYLGAPTTWTTKVTKLAKPGDILMSVRAPVGPINYSTQRICIGRGLAAIRPNENLDRDFLFYFLLHKQSEISGNTGAVFDSINKDQIASIQIPLPSLVKQKKIVEKLDKVFLEIDLMESNINSRLQSTTILSKSLIDFFLNNSPSLTRVKLKNISSIGYGYTSKSSQTKGNSKYLRITDIQNGKVDWSLVPYCEVKKEEFEKFSLQKGDIVFARTGATTGKSYMIEEDVNGVFASYLIRVVPDKQIVNPDFINIFFNSQEYWNGIEGGISGSAQGGFNASKLSELEIPLPSLNLQKTVVDKLKLLLKDVDVYKENLVRKKELLLELRNSVLAFNFSIKEVA